jgi:hypothetical protein
VPSVQDNRAKDQAPTEIEIGIQPIDNHCSQQAVRSGSVRDRFVRIESAPGFPRSECKIKDKGAAEKPKKIDQVLRNLAQERQNQHGNRAVGDQRRESCRQSASPTVTDGLGKKEHQEGAWGDGGGKTEGDSRHQIHKHGLCSLSEVRYSMIHTFAEEGRTALERRPHIFIQGSTGLFGSNGFTSESGLWR